MRSAQRRHRLTAMAGITSVHIMRIIWCHPGFPEVASRHTQGRGYGKRLKACPHHRKGFVMRHDRDCKSS